eukprot:11653673-Heterocapsa_arctica.AAC.1
MESDRDTFLAAIRAAGYDEQQAVQLLRQPQLDEDSRFMTPKTMGNRLASSPLSAPENVSIKSSSPRPVSWSILAYFKKSPGSAISPAALPLADS